MKNTIKIWGVLTLLATIVTGCAVNRELAVTNRPYSRQDVFREVQSGQAVAHNNALVKIAFPIKNFKSRFIDSYSKYTDPPYTAVITIDGQTVVLCDEPILETLTGDFRINPEVGTGWKYSFEKILVLQPGKHRMTITVPLADVTVEKDLVVQSGENELQLIPQYNASLSRYPNYPIFSKGIRGITIMLNGGEL